MPPPSLQSSHTPRDRRICSLAGVFRIQASRSTVPRPMYLLSYICVRVCAYLLKLCCAHVVVHSVAGRSRLEDGALGCSVPLHRKSCVFVARMIQCVRRASDVFESSSCFCVLVSANVSHVVHCLVKSCIAQQGTPFAQMPGRIRLRPTKAQEAIWGAIAAPHRASRAAMAPPMKKMKKPVSRPPD
jgi:hypothetical protein